MITPYRLKYICLPGTWFVQLNTKLETMRILRLKLIFCGITALLLTACSFNSKYVPSFVKPYRFDIQQGNFVTQEDTARLRVGMTKDQVRFIMGTPLLNDAFHVNRWDYVYSLVRADRSVVQARYTLLFKDDVLTSHGGENVPETLDPNLRPAPAKDLDTANPNIPTPESISGSERAPVMK